MVLLPKNVTVWYNDAHKKLLKQPLYLADQYILPTREETTEVQNKISSSISQKSYGSLFLSIE